MARRTQSLIEKSDGVGAVAHLKRAKSSAYDEARRKISGAERKYVGHDTAALRHINIYSLVSSDRGGGVRTFTSREHHPGAYPSREWTRVSRTEAARTLRRDRVIRNRIGESDRELRSGLDGRRRCSDRADNRDANARVLSRAREARRERVRASGISPNANGGANRTPFVGTASCGRTRTGTYITTTTTTTMKTTTVVLRCCSRSRNVGLVSRC